MAIQPRRALPIMDYTGGAPPGRGTLFRLEVYERVGISRVEIPTLLYTSSLKRVPLSGGKGYPSREEPPRMTNYRAAIPFYKSNVLVNNHSKHQAVDLWNLFTEIVTDKLHHNHIRFQQICSVVFPKDRFLQSKRGAEIVETKKKRTGPVFVQSCSTLFKVDIN